MTKADLTGKQLKEFRQHFNLRQKDCANIIGVGIRQWQKYEQGYPIKQIYIDVLQQKVGELNSPT